MTQGLIEFPMVQLRAEGAIAKDPINHQCGPLARPKWPARWPKIWQIMFRPDQPPDSTTAGSRDMVRARRKKPELQRKLRLFVKFGLAVSCTLSRQPNCLVDFVRPVENRKLVAPRAICQKWRLERKFLGGYSHGQFSSFSTEMEEDEDPLEFVRCCKLHVLLWLRVDVYLSHH